MSSPVKKKTEPTEPEPIKQAPLTSAEAWKVRGLFDQAAELRERANELDTESHAIAVRAAKRGGMDVIGPIEIVESLGSIVVRHREIPE